MKRMIFLAVVATIGLSAVTANAGVSVQVGDPHFYGRIDVGGYPQPQLIYPQPVVIEAAPAEAPPLYLHVPPGHAKNWRKHCRAYNACNRPVYFVQNSWYQQEYVPRYHETHANGHHHGKHND